MNNEVITWAEEFEKKHKDDTLEEFEEWLNQ